ncbi:hypothetical protein ACI6Q2_12000 [Chitinophagaceae bacterium LWZ2-11]
MGNLPVYISVTFILATFLTIFLFYKASNRSRAFIIIVLLWLALQTILSLRGFYIVTDTMPPRFPLLILPPLLLIASLFFIRKGRSYIGTLRTADLTLLHTVRIPVELTLYWLFMHKAVPQSMTFEGRNFDILSGLTAPFIYYFGFVQKRINKSLLLLWNFICLGLLINIVVTAALSAPTPMQHFAFKQPNIAMLYFPFVWLPCCVVPIVLFSHLATIKQLLKKPVLNGMH